MSTEDDTQRIADLVAQALELRDTQGGDPDIERLCAACPGLVDQVRRALKAAESIPTLQSEGIGIDPRVGTHLDGRYRIDERIGAGAMGAVYGAFDVELGRQVAVKIQTRGLMDDAQATARFEREAEVLAACRHESVVTIFDRGVTEDGCPFLVMERIDGVSLADVVDAVRGVPDEFEAARRACACIGVSSPMDPVFVRVAAGWMADVAGGLHAAHLSGAYHRDVKPSNVMIRRDGSAVLLDFGIAAIDDAAQLTRTDAAIGTLSYMAPEALQGSHGQRSGQSSGMYVRQDVYGLAATLYHLVTGRAPYEGSPTDVIAALALREPVPAMKLRPSLPRDIAAILDAGLARRPADRYAAPASVEADLRAFLMHRPVSVRPLGTATRLGRRFRRSRVAQGLAASVLLLALLAGGAAWVSSSNARRAARFDHHQIRLPANFGMVDARNRVLAVDAAQLAVEAHLDEMVAADAAPVTAHLLRGLARFDDGDLRAAASDMEEVRDAATTPLSRELAQRYRALADASDTNASEAAAGAPSLSLEGLPDAKTPTDRYVLVVHLVRAKEVAQAAVLVEGKWLAERHPHEVRLMVRAAVRKSKSPDGRGKIAAALYDEARAIEAQFGGPSAMTAHLRGTFLIQRKEFERSVEACQEAMELSPESHVSLYNLTHAANLAGQLDTAVEAGRALIALVPGYARAYEVLAEALVAVRDEDGAIEVILAAPYGDEDYGRLKRLELLELLETSRAMHGLLEGQTALATAAADEALAHGAAIAAMGVDGSSPYGLIAKALRAGDQIGLWRGLAGFAADDPISGEALGLLAEQMPNELEPEDLKTLQSIFFGLADHFLVDRTRQSLDAND